MRRKKTCHCKEIDWVAKILSFYANKKTQEIKNRFSRDILLTLATQLKQSPIPFPEQAGRKYLGPILRKFPARWGLKVTGLLKRIRNLQKRIHIRYPMDFGFNLLASKLLEESQFRWNGYRSAICITLDVDNIIGYNYLAKIMNLHQKCGIPGTINFLTHHDYKLQPAFMFDLLKMGNEIGLHGYDHDIALAYRSTKSMRRRLDSALRTIAKPVLGFRGPALCNSGRLFGVLEDLGVRYDSSKQVSFSAYRSTGINLPYPLLEHNLWELPLAIQDEYFFRDFKLGDSDTLKAFKRILVEIHELGGVAVLGFHPHLLRERPAFYKSALDLIRSIDDTWVTTTGNLFNFVSTEYSEYQKRCRGAA